MIWSGHNAWQWCLWTPQSVNNQVSRLNHNARCCTRFSLNGPPVRSKKRCSGLVWTGLQANLCCLQRGFGDERCSMDPEAHLEIRWRLPTDRSAATHVKHYKTGWTPTMSFWPNCHQIRTLSTSICGRRVKKSLTRHVTATQRSSRFPWLAHGCWWRKVSLGTIRTCYCHQW